MTSETNSPSSFLKAFQRIDLLGLLCAGIYLFFTLFPDSSTLILSWPWVIVWQIALFLPWLWVIKQWWLSKSFARLGLGLDFGMGLAALGIIGSCLLSPFTHQAIWYGWGVSASIVALYGLNHWCIYQQRRSALLTAQAGLVFALILLSLYLWSVQTLFPELERIRLLNEQGLNLSYNFTTLELRNWAPFGHQNYVAGYLVLGIPLLISQFFISNKIISKLWWGIGIILGFMTLYTTSSRGGWLGIGFGIGCGITLLMLNRRIPLFLRLIPGLALGCTTAIAFITNNRLRSVFFRSPLDHDGIDPYRQITNSIGWAIGKDHPFVGAGPGSVPMLFQRYRPDWSGLEAEWHFQLHSTPAQIWAEFGGLGILLSIGGMACLTFWGYKLWRSPQLIGNDRIRCWSIFAGLLGYLVLSLTDYQLNIIAIDGTLILYGVSLISLIKEKIPQAESKVWQGPRLKLYACSIIGLLIAMSFWVAPILKAWQLSSSGFEALQEQQISQFVQSLERSHQLAPWEPYYLYQLGLHIGKIGLNTKEEQLQKTLLDQSQTYLEKSVQASPYQEYGYTNLARLQLIAQKPEAIQSFAQASRLFPGRKLAFYELGLSLLENHQAELAMTAFSFEIVRNPIWMTSPVWNSLKLQPLYPSVIKKVEDLYLDLLQQSEKPSLKSAIHRSLGALYWWQGNLTLAEKQWQNSQTQLGLDLLSIDQGKAPITKAAILEAWLNQQKRDQWIEQAYFRKFQAVPDQKKVQTIVRGMNKATSFDEWLKKKPLTTYATRTRTGFGINAGHIDGPPPQDFSFIASNYVIATFFSSLFEMPIYDSSLDSALHPLREQLWTSIDNL